MFWEFLIFLFSIDYYEIRIFISITLVISLMSTIIVMTFYIAFIGLFSFGLESFFCAIFIY